jgi:pimeloyl-ACP methyl ester carboxylesterase
MTTTQVHSVRSADGTTIAFERLGSGPALILIEAAAHFRRFSSFDGLTPLLANHFTVYRYDRRGRGDSSDAGPYAVEREVEDLAALIDLAGGSASVYGYSSGALLAMHAAARGLHIPRLALLEPPLQDAEEPDADDAFTVELVRLVDDGRRSDAVEHFHAGIAVPSEIIEQIRGTPSWAAMESVAHTLVYDCAISAATTPELLERVTTPTLVLDSAGSTGNLSGWAATVARRLPDATHRSLAGEWHGVADDVLAPALVEFSRDRSSARLA